MLNTVLLTQSQDFFYELLFGTGAPLGFFLIAIPSLLLVYKVKEAGAIFVPFTLLMAIYLTLNIENPSFIWYINIMYYILAISLGLIMANSYISKG